MNPERRAAVFLDRDGVINETPVREGKPFSPSHWDDVRIPADVAALLQSLKDAGFLLVVITNQPDVARGIQKKDIVEFIHSKLMAILPLDEILTCYHDDSDGCSCRKPEPGLILQASEKYSIEIPSSFTIGDRWKDVESGRRAGCKTIFIDLGYNEEKPWPHADLTVSSLEEAVSWILKQDGMERGRV